MTRALIAIACALGGCDLPGPAAPDAAIKAANAPVHSVDGGPARLVAVTLEGSLSLGGAPKGSVLVAVTDGPCFAAGTHYLAMAAPDHGAWRAQVFAPEGSLLRGCAAVLPGGQRKTAWIGRTAGEVRAAGVSPMVARALAIVVRREAEPLEVPTALGARF